MELHERFAAFIADKGITVNQLAKELSYDRPEKLYSILRQRNKPSYETLLDILTRYPELSAEWLIRGQGNMYISALTTDVEVGIEITKNLPLRTDNGRTLVVTTDTKGKENMSLVPIPAQAGYSRQFSDPSFVEDLVKFTIPGFPIQGGRAFEVESDSMMPIIRHKDMVLCSYVDKWTNLAPGYPYVVVMENMIMVKRINAPILHADDIVELYSDNSHYQVHRVKAEDIREIWLVRGILTSQIPANNREVQDRLIEMVGFMTNNTEHLQLMTMEMLRMIRETQAVAKKQ